MGRAERGRRARRSAARVMVMAGRPLSSLFLCCCCALSLWSHGVFGVSYHVSSCKDFLGLPTPMEDDTHVIVLENISCKLVSVRDAHVCVLVVYPCSMLVLVATAGITAVQIVYKFGPFGTGSRVCSAAVVLCSIHNLIIRHTHHSMRLGCAAHLHAGELCACYRMQHPSLPLATVSKTLSSVTTSRANISPPSQASSQFFLFFSQSLFVVFRHAFLFYFFPLCEESIHTRPCCLPACLSETEKLAKEHVLFLCTIGA